MFPPSKFESLTYNCYPVPHDKNILEAFPALAEIPELNIELPQGIDKNKALRLLIYTYDPKCFLSKHFFDWKKQKMAAALLAGFTDYDEKTGLWPDAIDDLMKCNVPEFNVMVIRFCRIFHNHLYSLLVTSQDIFYYGLEAAMNQDIEKRKGKTELDTEEQRLKLLAKYESTAKSMQEYAERLLNNEQEQALFNLKRDLFCMVDVDALKKRSINPERQWKKLKEQENNPVLLPSEQRALDHKTRLDSDNP